jgi:5'-nucleotidase
VVSQLLNIVPADAITLGNHEFDNGVAEVAHFIDELQSPVIVSNIDAKDEPVIKEKYQKSIVINRDGRNIGLIGAIVVDTVNIANPEKLHFLDEIESVKREAERLKNENSTDIVIVLSHCGIEIDLLMAEQCGDLIDVIVGGHSHVLLYKGTPPLGSAVDTYPAVVEQSNGHKTLIVQASAYTKYLGDLTVYFDANGEVVNYEGNPIFIDASIEPDQEVVNIMAPMKVEIDAIGSRKVGHIKALLDRGCSTAECNLGTFLTDAFLDFIVSDSEFQTETGWTYASIALLHSGAIRNPLPPGEMTFDDLFTTFLPLPLANTLSVIEVKGEDLMKAFEFSAESYSTYNFLQFSGLRVALNTTSKQVLRLDALCQTCEVPAYIPMNPANYYRVIVPTFIGEGGNSFKMFLNKKSTLKTTKKLAIEVVEMYLKKLGPIIQRKDDRLIVMK